jgi:hypothetical protein
MTTIFGTSSSSRAREIYSSKTESVQSTDSPRENAKGDEDEDGI